MLLSSISFSSALFYFINSIYFILLVLFIYLFYIHCWHCYNYSFRYLLSLVYYYYCHYNYNCSYYCHYDYSYNYYCHYNYNYFALCIALLHIVHRLVLSLLILLLFCVCVSPNKVQFYVSTAIFCILAVNAKKLL